MNPDNRAALFLIAFLILIAIGAYWLYVTPGANENGNNGNPSPITGINWNRDVVRDQNGNTIIRADDFPGSIRVSEDESAEFGVAGVITDAMLSPDNTWLAVTMSGAAHGSAWLYDIEAERLSPVDFQYGGDLEVEAWSPDNDFVALLAKTPAETELIKVVDRRDIAEVPSNTGFVITTPEEAKLDPPFSYDFVEWQEPHTLCFTFEDTGSQCINAETENLET